MPKSKKRGGAKAHRKRVTKRNIIEKQLKEKQQKEFLSYMKKLQEESMKSQEQEVVNVDELGDIGEFGLSDEVVDALEDAADEIKTSKNENVSETEKVDDKNETV